MHVSLSVLCQVCAVAPCGCVFAPFLADVTSDLVTSTLNLCLDLGRPLGAQLLAVVQRQTQASQAGTRAADLSHIFQHAAT